MALRIEWALIKLTIQDRSKFKQPVWLNYISPQLYVLGSVTVIEINRVAYLAKGISQKFLLNENHSLVGKSCSKCGEFYTLDDFYSDKTQLFSKTTSCKYCRAERGKQFRANNPLYYREYWLNSREKMQQATKDWAAVNPERLAKYRARSVTKRQEALNNCLTDDKEYLELINSKRVCAITGITEHLALDHVLPVTKGRWGNNRGNLMWLAESFNFSKNSRNVFEWVDAMEQERLDYLLPDGVEMSVELFRENMRQALSFKAQERGLTLDQYKQEYIEEYNRKG